MKRYLWAAMIFVFVAANASGNPFDLSVNLKKIDQDQDALLSELKAMTEAKEEREEQEEQEKINKAEESAIEVDEIAVIQSKVTEEGKIKKITDDQVEVEAQRAEKEKAEQERAAAEKLEVEKYEAQRAAKKKLEAEELAQLEAEKAKLESKKVELEKQKAKLESEKLSQVKQKATKSVIVDINTTREEIEATKKADKAYKEAVVEVDKED